MAMVRVEDELHVTLRTLARDEGRPIGSVLQDAVRQYQRARFWDDMRSGYARLRSDPVAWQEYLAEAREWDQVAGDGLDAVPAAEFDDMFDRP
jgi:hypothetical protein